MSDAKRVSIADLRDHVGETVEVRGWLYNRRSSGKISFLLVRDGTGIVQGVLVEKEVDAETWDAHHGLTQESSLVVRGAVCEDARAPGGYELSISHVAPVQIAQDYPIGPKEHGIDFLLNHRHLWLRSTRPWHVMRVRDELIFAIREFFRDRDFVCLDSPILTRAIGEEAGTLFEPRNPRPGGTSPSSGCSSPRWHGSTGRTTCRSRRNSWSSSYSVRSSDAARTWRVWSATSPPSSG
jgi:asparaginyl-tRNA synthetase